ncbi:hypothetical protein GQ44DRAFT_788189 [Phaeosphaeriaceae sp. PMI808]|nr:hypothetical protein GQ44DRAFT_788189 [Phaeosphaeriaceae sp. PMI808]
MDQAEDVEIILTSDRRYKFHSGTLARNSTMFAGMLTEQNGAKLNSKATLMGIKVRWMIQLTRLPSEHFPGGSLELVKLTPTGDPVDRILPGIFINENGRSRQAEKAFTHYESIFYAFYNKHLTIDDSDVTSAKQDCIELLQIADYLGCTPLISKPVEVALLRHGQELFRDIQGASHLWIVMAHRIHSELIFKECMIHLVGKWNDQQLKSRVKASLREIPGLTALIEKYHRGLLQKCKAFELEVIGHYPGRMNKPSTDIPIKREAYAKDVLVWLALTFFRQFMTQQIAIGQGRTAKDCGYALYKKLGTGDEAYLDKAIINQFHVKFPMTRKAIGVVENHLFEIKQCINQKVVVPHKILASYCELDIKRYPVEHLTCIKFKREDLPWVKNTRAPQPAPLKRTYKPGGNDIARHNLQGDDMFGEEADEDFNADEDVEEEISSPAKRGRYD